MEGAKSAPIEAGLSKSAVHSNGVEGVASIVR